MDNYTPNYNTNGGTNTSKAFPTWMAMENVLSPKNNQPYTSMAVEGLTVRPKYYPAAGGKKAFLTFSSPIQNRTKSLRYYLGDNTPAPSTDANGNETVWLDVALFGRDAENAAKKLQKDPRCSVIIYGYVQVQTSQDGKPRLKLNARASMKVVRVLDPKGSQLEVAGNGGAASAANTAYAAPAGAGQTGFFENNGFTSISEMDDDDLPF